jgi:hypothetical protein
VGPGYRTEDRAILTGRLSDKRQIAPKAVDRFRERVRELTSRSRGVSTERMAEELTRCLRGWSGYFGKCETPSVLEGLERWFRRRLRLRSGRESGRQRTCTAAANGFAGTPYCAAPCLLDSLGIPRLTAAQQLNPPDADPHVRWCGRGEAVRLPPIPIGCAPLRGRLPTRLPPAPYSEPRARLWRVSTLHAWPRNMHDRLTAGLPRRCLRAEAAGFLSSAWAAPIAIRACEL